MINRPTDDGNQAGLLSGKSWGTEKTLVRKGTLVPLTNLPLSVFARVRWFTSKTHTCGIQVIQVSISKSADQRDCKPKI